MSHGPNPDALSKYSVLKVLQHQIDQMVTDHEGITTAHAVMGWTQEYAAGLGSAGASSAAEPLTGC